LFDVHNTRFNFVSCSNSYTTLSNDLPVTGCRNVWSFYRTGNQMPCASDLGVVFLAATLNYVCSSLKLAFNSFHSYVAWLWATARKGFDSFQVLSSRYLLTLSRWELRVNSFYLINNLYILYMVFGPGLLWFRLIVDVWVFE